MKKIFTFLLCVCSATVLLNAQVVISNQLNIADFEGVSDPTVSAFTGEDPAVTPNNEIVANPFKDALNGSDKVLVFARVDDGDTWSHKSSITLSFADAISKEDRNFIRMKTYAPDRTTCFRYTYYMDDVVVLDNWAQAIADCNGKWAYVAFSLADVNADFNKIRITVSDAWGTTKTPGVAYIDDIELYKEAYQYQEAFMGMVYEANKTSEVMEIDGLDLEDIWIDATYAPIEKIAAGDGVGISGEWAAVWDADYLYVFATITDNTIWKWSDANWAGWKGDGFQVYLDVLERRIDGRTFGGLSGFDISPDRESQDAIDAGKGFATSLGFGSWKSDAKQSSIMGGTGYTLEVAWPWKGLAAGAGAAMGDSLAILDWVGTNVKVGLEIAFDLQLNDDDGAGRVNMISWASEPKEPYGNSGTWGGLKLVGGTAVNNASANTGAKVYPSVTSDYLNVSMKNLRKIEVYDVTGKSLISKTAQSDNVRFDVSSLNNGVYLVKVSSSNDTSVQKFVKK